MRDAEYLVALAEAMTHQELRTWRRLLLRGYPQTTRGSTPDQATRGPEDSQATAGTPSAKTSAAETRHRLAAPGAISTRNRAGIRRSRA